MAFLQYRVHSLGWEYIACIVNVPPEVGANQQTTRRHTAKYSNYCHQRRGNLKSDVAECSSES
jgi:hypothetical protein